jgi:hypothetical protein
LILSTGNLIESFDDRDEALALLDRLVHDDGDAADHIAVIQYDPDCNPTPRAPRRTRPPIAA